MLAQICNTNGSATTFLNSPLSVLLIKFYRSVVVKQNFTTQLVQTQTFETFKEQVDKPVEDKSDDSQMSSLSLDEDGQMHQKKKKAKKPMSARTVLSEFGKTIYGDEDAEAPEIQDENDFEEEHEEKEVSQRDFPQNNESRMNDLADDPDQSGFNDIQEFSDLIDNYADVQL